MEKNKSGPLVKVLACSAMTELATGLALVVMPALVVALLLGAAPSAMSVPVARVAGIALIALGLACWPRGFCVEAAPFRALFVYNLLIAGYLAYLGIANQLAGLFLWLVVGLHTLVAGLLVYFRKV